MQWTDVQVELTTAATDLLLALVVVSAIVKVLRTRRAQAVPQRATVWAVAFGFLALAALLGFFAHGFALSEAAKFYLWQPLYLSLGLAMSYFAVGVIVDLVDRPVPAPLIGAFTATGVGFYAVTLFQEGGFLVFIVYEAAILVFALISYAILFRRRRVRSAGWMLAGIAVSMAAAAIQASGAVSFRLIWQFDHNGAFHLVQIVGIYLLAEGIARRSREPDSREIVAAARAARATVR